MVKPFRTKRVTSSTTNWKAQTRCRVATQWDEISHHRANTVGIIMMKSYILHLLLHHLQPVITDIERPIILIHCSLEKFFQMNPDWRKNHGSINKILSSDITTASLKGLILKEYKKYNTNNFFSIGTWFLDFSLWILGFRIVQCVHCDTWFDWQEIDQV